MAATWRLLDPASDVLAVISDHGQAPLHDLVDVNVVLAEAGLVQLAGHDVVPTSPMVGVGDGACAHLYLNLEGREPTGVVPPAEADELLRRAARALADVMVDGRAPVERVLARDELAALGLDHAFSGDLVVFLAPGFSFAHGLAEPTQPSSYYGQHGHLAHHDAMAGMYFARGAGIQRRRVDRVRAVDVAPRAARWLGIALGAGTATSPGR